jgi:hypothetical protein
VKPLLLGLLVRQRGSYLGWQLAPHGSPDGLDGEWGRRGDIHGETVSRGPQFSGCDDQVTQPDPERFVAIDAAAPIEEVEAVLLPNELSRHGQVG